jgi:hypothetical protein
MDGPRGSRARGVSSSDGPRGAARARGSPPLRARPHGPGGDAPAPRRLTGGLRRGAACADRRREPVPKLELARAGSAREAAEWYAGFGQNDLVEAIEWQLAEGTNDLETNPFVPLLRGYAMGQCPFVIDGEHVVVLRFGAPPT